MGLKSKALFTLTGMLAIVFLVFYIDAQLTLFPHFFHLENIEMDKNLDRVQNTINEKIESLKIYNSSFSQWNDTYEYLMKRNHTYLKNNFVVTTFTSADIDFYLLFDKTGHYYDGRYYDETKKQFLPMPMDLITELEANPQFITHTTTTSTHTGFIYVDKKLIALASRPVLTSSGTGPSPGSLIMGIIIDNPEVSELSTNIKFSLNFSLAPFPIHSNQYSIYQELIGGEKNRLDRISSNTAIGYLLVRDISKKPIGMLSVGLPRTLYEEGSQIIHYFFFTLVLLGIFILAAVWWVLRLLVLNRVISISNQVILINQEKNFTKRINLSGRDELNKMAKAMNSLLEIIEMIQEQLKFRISERTARLIRVSSLNKDLSNQINEQKIIETKLREEEFLLKQIAYFDVLTELPNRLYLSELLERHLQTAAIEKTSFALLFVDLDKFKMVNDTYGHDVGDAVLKILARRFKNCLRSEDVITRLGGDEFVIFVPHFGDSHLLSMVAQKLLDFANQPIHLDNIEITFGLSIGIAIYPEDGKTSENLIKNADIAMYQSKNRSGNNFYFYHDVEKMRPHPELL